MDQHEPFGIDRAGGLVGQLVADEADDPKYPPVPNANTPPSPPSSQ